MSNRIENFTNSIKKRLANMESQLGSVSSDIHADMHNDPKDLQSKLADARKNLKSIDRHMTVSNAESPKRIKAREANGNATIQGWKAEVKKTKLDDHAARFEDKAQEAISIAEAKVADAVLATYEAIEARISSNHSGRKH